MSRDYYITHQCCLRWHHLLSAAANSSFTEHCLYPVSVTSVHDFFCTKTVVTLKAGRRTNTVTADCYELSMMDCSDTGRITICWSMSRGKSAQNRKGGGLCSSEQEQTWSKNTWLYWEAGSWWVSFGRDCGGILNIILGTRLGVCWFLVTYHSESVGHIR
jgi:hypothetical protein